MKRMVFLMFMVACPAMSYAECKYNGDAYPEGTVIGGYVCEKDGSWRDQDLE